MSAATLPVGPGSPAGPGTPGPGPGRAPGSRRATRAREGAWLGGVCSGLAEHLGWPALTVRLGFVALALCQFLGVLLYALLWLALPPRLPDEAPAGLAAADRQHRRTAEVWPGWSPRRDGDLGGVVALGLVCFGLVWFVAISGGLGWSPTVFWPVAFACVGVALVWRTADPNHEPRRPEDVPSWLAPFVGRGRVLSAARIAIGMALVGVAVSVVIASQSSMVMLPKVLALTSVALVGVALVVAPWLHRWRTEYSVAREERVRADARADVAAHLHDSVLQTLAMIQRRADDPRTVSTLARRQERELRAWLFEGTREDGTLKAALASAAEEVELEHGVAVETVVVGDAPLDERIAATAAAAREALVNAARHSGAATIDLYAEAGARSLEVFVRDRGRGFDLARVPEDRHGVRGSILERMERHGGHAEIVSSPEGTEVRLTIDLFDPDPEEDR